MGWGGCHDSGRKLLAGVSVSIVGWRPTRNSLPTLPQSLLRLQAARFLPFHLPLLYKPGRSPGEKEARQQRVRYRVRFFTPRLIFFISWAVLGMSWL